MDRPRFHHGGRRLAAANSRFNVFFDRLEIDGTIAVEDFLVVQPKVRGENAIAGICVLPEVDGCIGLMRSHRHYLDEALWQGPAGFLEPDEAPAAASLRELEEETGLSCAAGDLISLGAILPDAGLIAARVALFVARNARPKTGDFTSPCTTAPCCAPDHPGQFPGDQEPGVGTLTFFTQRDLRLMLLESDVIGAATLIACHRYLALADREAGLTVDDI